MLEKVFSESGYGRPVDVFAIGVICYVLYVQRFHTLSEASLTGSGSRRWLL
jgi:hypothetical protein